MARVTGSWDMYDPDDPKCTAMEDQINSAAHDYIRSGRSYVLIALDEANDGSGFNVTSVINCQEDQEALTEALAELVIRMWFHTYDGAPSIVKILSARALATNLRNAISRYMVEEGIVQDD